VLLHLFGWHSGSPLRQLQRLNTAFAHEQLERIAQRLFIDFQAMSDQHPTPLRAAE
jgi:hypothetical protein